MGDKHEERARAAIDISRAPDGRGGRRRMPNETALIMHVAAALRSTDTEATAAERKRAAAIARAAFTSPGWSGAGECIATAIEKEPG